MQKVARVAATLGRALRGSAGSCGSLPGPRSASGGFLSRHAHDRFPRGVERSCVVDPNQEEGFWFDEVTDPEEEPVVADLGPKQSSPPPPPPPLALGHRPPWTPGSSVLLDLNNLTGPDLEDDSLVRFHDAEFRLRPSAVASVQKKKEAPKRGHKTYGTPDSMEPISDTRCSGCGAVLHCAHATVPGYLPSEKYKVLLREERLNSATCQRCHLLRHHQEALNLQVSKDEFRNVLRKIRSQRALVLLIVDLLDVPDSLVPELPDLVGPNKHVVVLGNKIDLLPADSPNHLQRIRRQLGQFCREAGFGPQRSWKYKGDVYLVGSANAGKSTLFNTLLQSDYCKSRASDVVGKATISPWPGTTLNLLKFPIINPTPYRMFRRHERLRGCRRQTEDDLTPDELKSLKALRRQGYLVGRVGRTFLPKVGRRTIVFDPDTLAFGEDHDGESMTPGHGEDAPRELTQNELKDAHWLFDTPGIIKDRDVLALLTQQEVKAVVPTRAVVPRTFLLKPGMSLFVGALARIDFLEGEKSCWFSVIASSQVPVHVSSVEKADGIYRKHAGRELLGVPAGGTERMKNFPALIPQDFRLEGRGPAEAAADVKLSSAGWVAVTALEGERPLLRVHGPPSAAFSLRTPPLLPHVVSLKGPRIPKSCAYKALTPTALLDVGRKRKTGTSGKDKRRAADKKSLN
ncbi:nitric oxide-associated protein 1 isoform X2 [Syngnathoides biaculeatus]|uniref:nitric oxide-associated protein 1 isoform X2 n=1 Tax=Syngnathoides biaculeatus TaxID=300417 RepID=UPI002ADD4F1F|nr:nitric oxide-associated protein 1 isoform X2 [Syngnathoides biaculeatus]